MFSKILVPESNPEGINKNLNISSEIESVNVIDALARGAADGVKLALNVGGMLLAFIAVIAALNYVLKDFIGELTGLNELILSSTNGGFEGLTLEYILGSGFRVIAFLMGVEWSETIYVGSLLGQKTVLNEFIAYESLKDLKTEQVLSLKSEIISAYALCGFANFSSIAIQIGGIGGMVPDRQGEISKFGLRALLAASLATISTATIAGVLF